MRGGYEMVNQWTVNNVQVIISRFETLSVSLTLKAPLSHGHPMGYGL